jgi:hypothetical protein
MGARPLHGDIAQGQREATLAGYRAGKFQVLVATDVAARGLDINGIELVIQMEPPKDPETYIHRSGELQGMASWLSHAYLAMCCWSPLPVADCGLIGCVCLILGHGVLTQWSAVLRRSYRARRHDWRVHHPVPPQARGACALHRAQGRLQV